MSPDGNNVYVGSNTNQMAVFGRVPDTTPPDTAIASGPDGQTSDSTPSFGFSSAESFLVRFECRFDAAAFGACSGASDHTAAPLADGPHTFAVRAVDTANNPDPAPATRAFTVDTVPPDTAITSGPTGTTNDATPTFGFSGSDLALAGFECQFDGAAFEACSGAAEHTAAQLNDGVHNFSVRARDGAGNSDASPATRGFSVDATPPDTAIASAPRPRPTTRRRPSASSSAEPFLERFECRFDAGGVRTCSCPPITPPRRSPTEHIPSRSGPSTPRATPIPRRRHGGSPSTPCPPTPRSRRAPTAATNDSTPTFGFSSAEPFLERFECRFDAAAFGPCSAATDHTAAPLADGAHTFAVRAVDTAGNPDPAPATREFTLDTAPPDTAITSGPTGTTNDPTPTFGFSGSDLALAGFECQLDGGPFEACSGASEHTAAQLNDGVHNFSVRARDGAGNLDASPATRGFSVDATAPDTQITRRPKNRVFTNERKVKVRFIWIADEPGGTFACALDRQELQPCGNKKAKFKVKAKGGKGKKHFFRVQAIDAVGNPDPTPAIDRFRAILR